MLSPQQLTGLLSRPEGEFLERKSAIPNAREIRKTLVAFANSVREGEHGVLLLGQSEDLQVTGIADIDGAQKTVRDIAEKDCYPAVRCQLSVVPAGASNVLAVIIELSKDRPHFTGPAFVRRGSESVNATKEQFEELIASRVEKARVILAHKNELVSVQSSDDFMSNKDNFGNWMIPIAQRDYRINACDAQCVELEDMNYHAVHVVPLSKVQISRSVVPARMLLIVEVKLS